MNRKPGNLDALKVEHVPLFCLSLAELKRYLWKLLFPRSWSIEFILHWSFWRRKHQASARFFHYRKHGQIS